MKTFELARVCVPKRSARLVPRSVVKNKLTYIGKLGKYKISENLVKEIAMTNEEILKAAQSSKEDVGEYEKTIVRKSLAYGSAVGVGLCMIMVLLELLIFKRVDFGKPALIFAIAGYADFYEGVKCKITKRKIKGIVELVVAAFGILLYIGAFWV